MTPNASFDVGFDFGHVLAAISKQIYETPLAFLRENVQNAVDAIRIQALRDKLPASDSQYKVDVTVNGKECRIRDNGLGMTFQDLRELFWKIGASGKRNEEARKAGCVGMFGIGGFANLGVCDKLTVISQTAGNAVGRSTWLSEEVIRASAGGIPQVQSGESTEAAPRGTIVIGQLRAMPNINELQQYLTDFVRYADEHIYFNGKLVSRGELMRTARLETLNHLCPPGTQWQDGNITITGTLIEESLGVLAQLTGLAVDGKPVRFAGLLRFEGGALDVFKRGFKLCATKVQTQIGVSGRIDCDILSPTAGRDSLDAESNSLVSRIALRLERAAAEAILQSTALLNQHTRLFPYYVRNGMTNRLDNVEITLADGSETTLGMIRSKAQGGVGVYFGSHQKQALSAIMQARGNIVVLLPADSSKQRAVSAFLESQCQAKSFSGVVELSEVYKELDRFEKMFLSQMETTIYESYEVESIRLIPGRLTEDIPVFIREGSRRPLEIFVDVRHPEISKLRSLGFSPLVNSLISAFCREYLGSSLRKMSPKFFGSGAINLDMLAKKRSELWILLKDDIHTVSRQSQRQVMRRTDVQTVHAGRGSGSQPAEPGTGPKKSKLLRIVGDDAFSEILGYYIRIPDGAAIAFGDVIKECDGRGVLWGGNKILFVASDKISSSFQFEIRLDHLIVTAGEGGQNTVEGAREVTRPVQEMNEGLYFPIPEQLESVLVPDGDREVRIEVSSGEWIDTENAHAWRSRQAAG
jgi:molecular chaperone HtpG